MASHYCTSLRQLALPCAGLLCSLLRCVRHFVCFQTKCPASCCCCDPQQQMHLACLCPPPSDPCHADHPPHPCPLPPSPAPLPPGHAASPPPADACNAGWLGWYVQALHQFGRPIWLTEFACPSPDGPASATMEFMAEALEALDADTQVGLWSGWPEPDGCYPG